MKSDYSDRKGISCSDAHNCPIYNLPSNTMIYYAIAIHNDEIGVIEKRGSIRTKLSPPTVSNITATSTYNSIDLSYTMSGTVTSRTCKYGTSNGNYNNTVNNSSSTKCSITSLAENTTYYYQVCAKNVEGQNCKTGSIATKKKTIADEVNIGDYISMTPTATSYKILKANTGYTADQTINPSELNLWRVIRKNSDGTVDAVSEYVSSKAVYFKGSTGYQNLVGTLNTIAAQYTNSLYVSKTRHIGYSNQIEFCTSYASSLCPSDLACMDDLDLIKVAYGSPECDGDHCYGWQTTKKGESLSDYWVSSRLYSGSHRARYVSFNSILSEVTLMNSSNEKFSVGFPIRPIITIKGDVRINTEVGTRTGSLSWPYLLS